MLTKVFALDKAELLQYKILLPFLAFTIPFLISGPQLLTGSIVNSFLFLASTKLSYKHFLPVAILPSVGALSNGILFDTFTPFLLYFLPFIWIGNIALIVSFKKFRTSLPQPISLVLSSLLKTSILYVSAMVFFQLHLVPQIFLTAMGIFQFITAIAGGILAFSLLKITNK